MHWTFADFDAASVKDINQALEVWKLEDQHEKATQRAR